MIPLAQWLSIRRVMPSRAHLAVAGDLFGYQHLVETSGCW